jgi:phospholipid/cholesterol/gamma-HCH transport system ATP-binding protein
MCSTSSPAAPSVTPPPPRITVADLTMAYGGFTIQRGLAFTIARAEIFVIMGGSGSGKSTLLNHMVGLRAPASGDVLYDGHSFWHASGEERDRLRRQLGVSYQGGALWSSMTLAENVALPLETFTELPPKQIRDIVSLKLALVGLAGFEEFYPAEISGGMLKRAAVARAMALDPDILFFDEPSAGLDPITSRRLDDLILDLRVSLGATMVVVTHELPSIFAIADRAVFLDAETRTMIALGNPKQLRDESPDAKVRAFLTRGGQAAGGSTP